MTTEETKAGAGAEVDGRLVERLRKLLERSGQGAGAGATEGQKAATEQEQVTAASLLARLLEEHNLSVADLEQKGAQGKAQVGEQAHDLGKAAFKWKLDLAEGIAEFYYCYGLVDRANKTVKFIGRPDNVESLKMLYGWVIEQVKKLATEARREHQGQTGEHIDPLRWQVGFGVGCVGRLIERLKEMKARAAEDMARNEMGDVVALAVHHQTEIGDWMEDNLGYRRDGKMTKGQEEREKAWEARRRREEEEKNELRVRCEEAGDMQPFWDKYPGEHPDEVKRREEASARWWKEYEAKERRNARRRTGGGRQRQVDWEKEEQTERAERAGRERAGRVNLQPFMGEGDRKKTKGEVN